MFISSSCNWKVFMSILWIFYISQYRYLTLPVSYTHLDLGSRKTAYKKLYSRKFADTACPGWWGERGKKSWTAGTAASLWSCFLAFFMFFKKGGIPLCVRTLIFPLLLIQFKIDILLLSLVCLNQTIGSAWSFPFFSTNFENV